MIARSDQGQLSRSAASRSSCESCSRGPRALRATRRGRPGGRSPSTRRREARAGSTRCASSRRSGTSSTTRCVTARARCVSRRRLEADGCWSRSPTRAGFPAGFESASVRALHPRRRGRTGGGAGLGLGDRTGDREAHSWLTPTSSPERHAPPSGSPFRSHSRLIRLVQLYPGNGSSPKTRSGWT